MSEENNNYDLEEIRLTQKEIKKHKEQESMSDEDADNLSYNIYQFSTIIFEIIENNI